MCGRGGKEPVGERMLGAYYGMLDTRVGKSLKTIILFEGEGL